MSEYVVPSECNYIAIFLTFTCQLRCTYCINHHGGDLIKDRRIDGQEWIKGINKLTTRSDLPITIQGGEPTVHRDFFQIINGIKREIPIDLLTNLEIDAERFAENIPPERLRRDSPYASIRVSYHHGQSDFGRLTKKVKYLSDRGYHIGIWEVDHPSYHGQVIYRQQVAHSMGIDYRLKEFLGPWKGKNYGTFRYDGAVNNHRIRSCDCRTSELLIAPDGQIFRCHSDLYANRLSVGNICSDLFPDTYNVNEWRPCQVYGKCNSCDIKVKTNRFQEYGHSSVDIKNISNITYINTTHQEDVTNTYGKK